MAINDKILRNLFKIPYSFKIQDMPVITDEPKFYGYLCFPSNSKQNLSLDSVGIGYNKNKNLAKIKAIAELIERDATSELDENSLYRDNYNRNNNYINPLSFLCYSQTQIKELNIDTNKIINQKYNWIEGINLKNNKKVKIPGQMVFVSTIFDDEYPIRRELISTGTAFGDKDSRLALEGGIKEIIERDSAMGAYFGKIELRKIKNFPKKINTILQKLERYDLEYHIFDITSDLEIPSVMVIVLDKTGIGDVINIGLSTDQKFINAIQDAIFEAIQFRRLNRITKNKYNKKINIVNNEEDRYWYWNTLERIEDLNKWLNKSSIDFKELNDFSKGDIVNHLVEKGYDMYLVDISPSYIKRTNFEVLKILMPQLHPLYLNESAKSLYSEHYGEIKEKENYIGPHPFG